MCGRYYRRSDKQRIAEAFKVGKLPPGFELPPDYNIAPSTYQPVIRADAETGERALVHDALGVRFRPRLLTRIVSRYSTQPANARAEIDSRQADLARDPFQHSRCLSPR